MSAECFEAADDASALQVDAARPGAAVRPGLRMLRLEHLEAAVPLSEDERPAYQRRFTTLFVDDGSARRGGLGRVVRATNVRGETIALKTLVLPDRDEREAEDAYRLRLDGLRASFRREYEEHRRLSGFKGAPRLYGYGEADGSPAILMEWVEGETLDAARRLLAVDDDGRLPPLTAARIGRDLFELLARIDAIYGGFVHRDISPANVMVRTAHVPVREQAEEGMFDLCLVDFGSSASAPIAGSPSYTEQGGVLRMATPAYAPPEMLSADMPHVSELRKSPLIDVYGAASVLYELVAGKPPYDLQAPPRAGGSGEGAGEPATGVPAASPYRIKMDGAPQPPRGAHEAAGDLSRALVREPEVAVIAMRAALDQQLEPDAPELCDALVAVDEQLSDLLMACLAAEQRERPAASAVADALAAFCGNYGANVARALGGEPLIPCAEGSSWLANTSPAALRRTVRIAGTALSAALLVAVAVTAGALLDGAAASFEMGSFAWSGRIPGALVGAGLLLPAVVARGVCAVAARRSRRGGFIGGTIALLLASGCMLYALSGLHMAPVARERGLFSAVCAAGAAAWCPLVLDYAMVMVPRLAVRARRRLAGGGGARPGFQAARPDKPAGSGGALAQPGERPSDDEEAQ